MQVAEAHADTFCERLRYPRSSLRFAVASIEDLHSANIHDGSQDILISNCVINLSSNKQKVFDEAYRILAYGGELYFSDMYADMHLASHVMAHQVAQQLLILWLLKAIVWPWPSHHSLLNLQKFQMLYCSTQL